MKQHTNVFVKLASCMAAMKLSRILIMLFLLLIAVPIFVHYYLSKVEKDVQYIHRSRLTLDIFEDFSSFKAAQLKSRIKDMLRIKASVANELRNFESKNRNLQKEITSYHQRKEELKSDILKLQSDLNKLKTSIEQAQLTYSESVQRNSPELALPIPLLANELPATNADVPPPPTTSCLRMHNCFDYSRCSLTSGFPVYLYDPEKYFPSWQVPSYLKTLIRQTSNFNPHFIKNAKNACVFLILTAAAGDSRHLNTSLFNSLPYWGGDGRNHIILNLATKVSTSELQEADLGKAILVQSSWNKFHFRHWHDIVSPPILGPPGGEVWMNSPYLLPARKNFLLSFQGSQGGFSVRHSNLDNVLRNIYQYLTQSTNDKFHLEFNCTPSSGSGSVEEWNLCETEEKRSIILTDSTFVLIPSAINDSTISSVTFLVRLFEALKYGAIPFLLGGDQMELPFNEVIDWRKALVSVPVSRITECHWLLRSFPDNDLLLMKRQGKLLYEKYFATGQSVLDTILAVIRNRILLPPPPITDAPSPSVFGENFTVPKMDPIVSETEPEENLGPLEPPFNSLKFIRNFSLSNTQNYEMWNIWADPFRLYPNLPFDPVLPSEAKFIVNKNTIYDFKIKIKNKLLLSSSSSFRSHDKDTRCAFKIHGLCNCIGSEVGFRAINRGAGGAGKEFCESLGGNMQKEQFTIVMLTYEREQVLINSLSRLHGLPYLNKVIVVWNSPSPPSTELRWPDIGVPIHVVRARKNSLNNRFLPYSSIQTEAVLSVDDDAHLRHDEIIFGFRVWREQRDRIVGFPGRYHALDLNHGGWLYNSNYSCELSMVLTGAAFLHKYYLYVYTYQLSQAVRDLVDEYMNCEDIAMNFLVSHITRKPPVKVTSRWTFRCPGCPVSLSEDETHFNERHRCINFFTKVFGYTPLLYTQFRADSILFKTRIPHDKQKCFKFI